jgi:enoyl-CoA hydratase/carnithine racemase
MSNEGEIRTNVNGRILGIEVDRSEKMNGFTPEMFASLRAALRSSTKARICGSVC